LASPEYVATMLCVPAKRLFHDTEADPELIGAVPKLFAPSANETVPVAPGVSVAVSVTRFP
jgi:hypothetical protein